jgi:hypothetical protein
VYPSLTYSNIDAAITWLQEAFGFEGQILDDVAAILRHGNGTTLIQLDRPYELHGSHTGQGSMCGTTMITSSRVPRNLFWPSAEALRRG